MWGHHWELVPSPEPAEQTCSHGRDPGATAPWSPLASWRCRRGPRRGLLLRSLGLAAVGPIAWKPSQNEHPWVPGWPVCGWVGVSRAFRVKRLNLLLTDPLEISHFNNKRNVTILASFCREVYLDMFLCAVLASLWIYLVFFTLQSLPLLLFSFSPICKSDYSLSCLWFAGQLVPPMRPGPGPASILAAHFTLHPPSSVACPSALFYLLWGHPSCHIFILQAIWYLPGVLAWPPALSSG